MFCYFIVHYHYEVITLRSITMKLGVMMKYWHISTTNPWTVPFCQ